MGAAYRGPQGVGGVVRPGNIPKPQEDTDKGLHLLFIRGGIAYHRLLNGPGGEFPHREAPFRQGQGEDPPGFRHGKGACFVPAEIEGFDGGLAGFIGFQDGADAPVDKKKAVRLGTVRLSFYTAVGDIPQPPVIEFDYSPTGRGQTRINADDPADL
jgi:hypothetical protein